VIQFKPEDAMRQRKMVNKFLAVFFNHIYSAISYKACQNGFLKIRGMAAHEPQPYIQAHAN
jgi:hypothetical protein